MPDDQARTIVYLLAYGDLRWGELVALRRGRIDVLRRRIEIAESATEISGRLTFGTPKTNRRRRVHVPGFVADLLGRRLDLVPQSPDAFVFTSPMGRPLRSSNFRRTIWNRARNLAGTDLANITPHDLRHTCASLMRAEGADVKEIQQQLGHRTATITLDVYTHLFEGDLTLVMDRLDSRARGETRPARVLAEVHRLPDQQQTQP